MDKACPFLNKKCIGSFCAFSDRDKDCIIRQFFQSHIDKKYAESEQAALELGWFDEFFQYVNPSEPHLYLKEPE